MEKPIAAADNWGSSESKRRSDAGQDSANF